MRKVMDIVFAEGNRLGIPVVLATDSTAQTPNWWTQFSPVPGVLLNRSQTPFFLIDYDSYNAIKPAAASR